MPTMISIAKTVTTFIVGAGTTKIVGGIIRNNTAPEKLSDQIAIGSAAIVIGSMAADATRKYTDLKIDEFEAWRVQFKEKLKKTESTQ